MDQITVRKMTPGERMRRLEDFGRFFFGHEWKAPTYRVLAAKDPDGPTHLTRQRWDRIMRPREKVAEAVPDWMIQAIAEYVEEKFDELALLRRKLRGI